MNSFLSSDDLRFDSLGGDLESLPFGGCLSESSVTPDQLPSNSPIPPETTTKKASSQKRRQSATNKRNSRDEEYVLEEEENDDETYSPDPLPLAGKPPTTKKRRKQRSINSKIVAKYPGKTEAEIRAICKAERAERNRQTAKASRLKAKFGPLMLNDAQDMIDQKTVEFEKNPKSESCILSLDDLLFLIHRKIDQEWTPSMKSNLSDNTIEYLKNGKRQSIEERKYRDESFDNDKRCLVTMHPVCDLVGTVAEYAEKFESLPKKSQKVRMDAAKLRNDPLSECTPTKNKEMDEVKPLNLNKSVESPDGKIGAQLRKNDRVASARKSRKRKRSEMKEEEKEERRSEKEENQNEELLLLLPPLVSLSDNEGETNDEKMVKKETEMLMDESNRKSAVFERLSQSVASMIQSNKDVTLTNSQNQMKEELTKEEKHIRGLLSQTITQVMMEDHHQIFPVQTPPHPLIPHPNPSPEDIPMKKKEEEKENNNEDLMAPIPSALVGLWTSLSTTDGPVIPSAMISRCLIVLIALIIDLQMKLCLMMRSHRRSKLMMQCYPPRIPLSIWKGMMRPLFLIIKMELTQWILGESDQSMQEVASDKEMAQWLTRCKNQLIQTLQEMILEESMVPFHRRSHSSLRSGVLMDSSLIPSSAEVSLWVLWLCKCVAQLAKQMKVRDFSELPKELRCPLILNDTKRSVMNGGHSTQLKSRRIGPQMKMDIERLVLSQERYAQKVRVPSRMRIIPKAIVDYNQLECMVQKCWQINSSLRPSVLLALNLEAHRYPMNEEHSSPPPPLITNRINLNHFNLATTQTHYRLFVVATAVSVLCVRQCLRSPMKNMVFQPCLMKRPKIRIKYRKRVPLSKKGHH